MNLLSDNDRKYILEQLQLAPDCVLADAMLAFNTIRDKVMIVRKMVERIDIACEPVNEAPVVRSNVSPGKSMITKIGSETKAALLVELASNKQPAAKFAEHLKLLWERGEVKFDGKEYYL